MNLAITPILIVAAMVTLPACSKKSEVGKGRSVSTPHAGEQGQDTSVAGKTNEPSIQPGAVQTLKLSDHVDMAFAYCPVGEFWMGKPLDSDLGEVTENQVKVAFRKGFWMAKTEVTQTQWNVVMGSNDCYFHGSELPVENVSWESVQNFIKKVNASGSVPSGWMMVLPTEAQWEYACRAGETGMYSGGSIDEVAWYVLNSRDRSHPVATKKPNAWGLYDMHGNVYEWCADSYQSPLQGGVDPLCIMEHPFRVYRGGSWKNADTWSSSDSRYHYVSHGASGSIGFRPALVPADAAEKKRRHIDEVIHHSTLVDTRIPSSCF